jgi:hypothetical protein
MPFPTIGAFAICSGNELPVAHATGELGWKIRRLNFCYGSGTRWALALKLDPALLHDAGLLNSNHLPLHLSQFGRRLFVATDKERRRPKYNHRSGGRDGVVRSLLILRARKSGGSLGNTLSLHGELWTGILLIHDRRYIGRRDIR